jgi:BON domain
VKGGFTELVVVLGTNVGQFVLLPMSPNEFHGVQFRGVGWEVLGVNPAFERGNVVLNQPTALIQNKMHGSVKYDVKNGVVTLTGEVNSENKRARAEKVATGVPNVTQVVNNLQVKNQKASSSQ